MDKTFQRGARKLQQEMFRSVRIARDKRLINLRFHGAGQFNLCFFRSLLDALQCQAVFGQINAFGLLKLCNDPFNDLLVKVIPAQARIAIGGADFYRVLACGRIVGDL